MLKAFFQGNVSTEPELRGVNKNVLTFSVAVNTRKKDPDSDKWVEAPQFFPFVMFGKRAEAVGSFLKKGAAVSIEATPSQNVWEDEKGKRSSIEFIVDDIHVDATR
ncbi:Helix-destabilizing protein [Slackia heliotrinireducens]|uniref:Single-stranded DNA-binding protein n=1 Tax=Slackia heliotrinireducens (strain ATCC 29202 / DSM 20476 / NCTC 11029 / RHS 1) TaxID=471855 RepID=C7N7Z7_SLAHD|nr:single-stranded DNA-binding protein [Slackia heliotrinireducens]ACV23032.1 single-stranded DNA-binding protein [Slackia heliotrinireducens DSM 20476]VEH01953.1 Helix-destabilizing protein [Slackia heliotrinireducens]